MAYQSLILSASLEAGTFCTLWFPKVIRPESLGIEGGRETWEGTDLARWGADANWALMPSILSLGMYPIALQCFITKTKGKPQILKSGTPLIDKI